MMPDWVVAAATAIGSSHVASGESCQDALQLHLGCNSIGESFIAIAISDGAGSAVHGLKGAETSTKHSVELLVAGAMSGEYRAGVESNQCADLLTDVQHRIGEEAREFGCEPRDLACTFLGALVWPESATFLQIGDGAIVYRTAEVAADYDLAFWPATGEYANTTHFVSDDDALFNLQVKHLAAAVDELALFTDGIQRLALDYAERRPHVPFFKPIFDHLRSATSGDLSEDLRMFLESERVAERSDDDKGMVLVARVR